MGGVCRSLGGMGVLWGVGLFAAGVSGLPGVEGGKARDTSTVILGQ